MWKLWKAFFHQGFSQLRSCYFLRESVNLFGSEDLLDEVRRIPRRRDLH